MAVLASTPGGSTDLANWLHCCLRISLLLEDCTTTTISICITDIADRIDDPLLCLTLVLEDRATATITIGIADIAHRVNDLLCCFTFLLLRCTSWEGWA